jgi:hypothetical protein
MTLHRANKPRTRRRWLQFSLRTLLIVVFLWALLFGWLGLRLHRARRQRIAIEALEARSAWTLYDYQYVAEERPSFTYQYPHYGYAKHGDPPVSEWLCDLFGVDFFASVVFVNKGWGNVGHGDLMHLDSFPNLEELQLYRTDVTDEDLAHLASLRRLRLLDVSSDDISDEGLTHLASLVSLEEVYLGGTKLTDAGIARLRDALPNARIYRYGKLPPAWTFPEEEATGAVKDGSF